MQDRILLVRRKCPHCREFAKVINLLNLRLPIEKRIRIIDGFDWEEFSVELYPIMRFLSKRGFDSYPFLYVDSIIITNSPSPEVLKTYLQTLLNEEMLF